MGMVRSWTGMHEHGREPFKADIVRHARFRRRAHCSGAARRGAGPGNGLQTYNRRRKQTRRAAADRGQSIVAELPGERDLTLFSEDQTQFYYADHAIPKDQIHAVRVLINGSPIAVCLSPRFPSAASAPATSVDERPEGIAHDRWDVAIEATSGTTVIACGAIREGVSQGLARKIFEAVKKDVEV